VVDDEEINRCLIAAILGQRGYEIVHACDGAQALALVARSDIDLVLLVPCKRNL
jgi:CheY-like chemotaxis protein